MIIQPNEFIGRQVRFRANVGDEGAIALGGAEYTRPLNEENVDAYVDSLVNIRMVARKVTGAAVHTINLNYQLNGSGSWFPVSLLSAPLYIDIAPDRYPPGSDTTLHADQLSGDVAADWNGAPDNGAATGGIAFATNSFDATDGATNLEHEWTLRMGGAENLSVGDYIELRMYAGFRAFTRGYNNTPRIDIVARTGPVCPQPPGTIPSVTTQPGQILSAVSTQPGATVAAVTARAGRGLLSAVQTQTPGTGGLVSAVVTQPGREC